MSTLVFVYGTLKRGFSNHSRLAGQKYLGPARTVPGFRLFELDGFPALVAWPEDRAGVVGEVWSVDRDQLLKLDVFEGVQEGMYRREPIALQSPFAQSTVYAYFAGRPTLGREIGSTWEE
ncbi:MAG: gamma-glutamylcyclotransferase family protein [Opitutaceae bacterium]